MKISPLQDPDTNPGTGPNQAGNLNNSRVKGMAQVLRKLGWAGFLFFLIKGLIWIAVFYGLGRYIGLGSGE